MDKTPPVKADTSATSSNTWFVLRRLLGYENVLNYDRSWTEYGSIVRAPIER